VTHTSSPRESRRRGDSRIELGLESARESGRSPKRGSEQEAGLESGRDSELEQNRELSKNMRQHKIVRVARARATVDEQLKALADINRPAGHVGLDIEALVTASRARSETEIELEHAEEAALDSALGLAPATDERPPHHPKTVALDDLKLKIRSFIDVCELELVVVVESVEPRSGSTFQARHSYTGADICFDRWFAPSLTQRDGAFSVDLDSFQVTKPCRYPADIRAKCVL
jgi:hypothetical protein